MQEKILTLKFESIHCEDCARKIERHLLHFPGIRDVNLLVKNKRVHITLDTQPATSGDILHSLRSLGFPAEVVMLDDTVGISELGKRESFFQLFRKRLLRWQLLTGMVLTGILLVLMILFSFFEWSWIQPASLLLTLPVVFWVSFPLFRGFLHSANRFDLLLYLTAFALFGVSIANEFFLGGVTYYFLVSFVFTLSLASKYLEKRAQTTARVFEGQLHSLLPTRTKVVLENGTKRYVALRNVKVGDVLEIRSQDVIPADGVVVLGNSTVDESFLAGESLPQERGIGSFVLAGSRNQSGTLQMKVHALGEGTVLHQMMTSLRAARKTVSHIQRLLDKIAWVIIPVILLVAAGTFLGWYFGGIGFMDSLRTASAVLLVASPYTLSRACVVAYAVALQKAATRGIFFKNVNNLEQLPRVSKAIFSLYPTLTHKKIEVTDIIGGDRFKIIQMVGSLESYSHNHLAQALVEKALGEGVTLSRHVKDVYEHHGLGIEGTVDGRTVVIGSPEFIAQQSIDISVFQQELSDFALAGKIPLILATRKEILGVVAFRFSPSQLAVRSLKELGEAGIHTFLMSGHFEPSLQKIARELHVKTVLHEIHDELRSSVVTGLAKTRGLLLAVAAHERPAIFQSAQIGVIMKEREAVTFHDSDILLTRFGLTRLPVALHIARHARRVVSQNILWGFVYNIVSVFLAFTHIITPELAIVLSVTSPLIVIVNSLRLKNDPKTKRSRPPRRRTRPVTLSRSV